MSYAIVKIILGYTCRNPESAVEDALENYWDDLAVDAAGDGDVLKKKLEEAVATLNIQTGYCSSGDPDDLASYIGWELCELDSYETESLGMLLNRAKIAEANISHQQILDLVRKLNDIPQELKDVLELSEYDKWTIWSDS